MTERPRRRRFERPVRECDEAGAFNETHTETVAFEKADIYEQIDDTMCRRLGHPSNPDDTGHGGRGWIGGDCF